MTGSTIPDAVLRSLQAPIRNKYFYGKLLEARHFELEQCYSLQKRWLLNRLTLGAGVLCGLTVTAGADGRLGVSTGVAIDGLGREILVPAPVSVDPAQPTDDLGRPSGDKLTSGQTTVYLCYTECDAEPTLVAIADCDGAPSTAAGATVERFRLLVRAGVPAQTPAELTDAQRDAIFPAVAPADFRRLPAAEQALAPTCTPPDEACVVLATITLPEGDTGLTVDEFSYRAEVFSNSMLFELIAALASRVDACCAALDKVSLSVTDGDDQTAAVGAQVPAPVHLLASDAAGDPQPDEAVDLATTDPNGLLSVPGVDPAASISVRTDADGVLAVTWQLGDTAGEQSFTATLTATGASIDVHATATAAAPAPPVVTAIRPTNGAQAEPDWLTKPTLTLSFDQPMDPAGLADPDPWLRAWWFRNVGQGEVSKLTRMKVAGADPHDGAGPFTFALSEVDQSAVTVVVLMRGASPQIQSAIGDVALDADFAGTRLDEDQVNKLWESDELAADADFIGAISAGPDTLPSGDGTAGGWFHSYFTAVRPQ